MSNNDGAQVRGYTKAGHGPWSIAVEASTTESSE